MSPTAGAIPRICVLIPAYNEAAHIERVCREVRALIPDVVVIDDGSRDRTAELATATGVKVLRQPVNLGKGAVLNVGFAYARAHGFDAVITMDADGQHLAAEVPKFIETYRRTRIPVLIGNRIGDLRAMPAARRYTNRLMSWLLSRVMRQYIADTQCGFRLYRCDTLQLVTTGSQRFAAESEILLSFAHRGIRMDSVRVSTVYADEQSKINPLPDTWRFFKMLWKHRRRVRRRRHVATTD